MINVTIYHNANIYTVDENLPIAASMAVLEETIVAVGSLDYVKRKVESMNRENQKYLIDYVDVKGKLILPSFVESHAHPSKAGTEMLYQANLSNCKTASECVDVVKAFIKKNPESKFILGSGWSNTYFDIKGPRKELLDELTEDIPILLISADHHSTWVNSKTLQLAGVDKDTPDISGGVIERDSITKEPLGTFREEAHYTYLAPIIPTFTMEQLEEAWLYYQTSMAELGIAMVHDARLILGSDTFVAVKNLAEKDKLLFRVTGAINTVPNDLSFIKKIIKEGRSLNCKKFQVDHAKFFIDGVLEGHTAFLKEAYIDDDSYFGEKLWEDDQLLSAFAELDSEDWKLHFHVIGDAAMEQVLDVLEELENKNGRKDRRPIIAHAQLVQKSDFERVKSLGATISSNPFWFTQEDGYFENIEVPFLGEKRARIQYPMKSFWDKGIVVASASDFFVTADPNPLIGIMLGVIRVQPESINDESKILGKEECVTLEQMVKSFTLNGAILVGLENITGSITEGKFADFIILEENIFEIPIEKVSSVKVLKTFAEGKEIYSRY